MSTALKPAIGLFNPAAIPAPRSATVRSGEQALHARSAQLADPAKPGFSRLDYAILSVLVVAIHVAAIHAYQNAQQVPAFVPQKKNEVMVEFIKPEPPPPPPPPKIEPPKPQPKVLKQVVPPKPVPVLKTAPAAPDIKADDIVIKENTEAQHTTAPVVAEPSPPPAPPAPPKEEPVTEASGYAGYLNNPPPEYPAFAQRQGWEGKVILRVRVLASGKPGSVELKQSSGRKTLDEAALEVVKGWTFAPAKRGSTPIDGWATVPIEFKLAK